MKQIKSNSTNRPVTSSLPLEDKIRVIANLIVDQMIEIQRVALKAKNQENKEA